MNIPRRLKRPKMNVRETSVIRCASHLKWIRGHACAASDMDCQVKIEAAHVRTGTDGGMGMKPSDCWTIPLCSTHHRDQHQIGEPAFERENRIDMKAIAKQLWTLSPHGKKWRLEHP